MLQKVLKLGNSLGVTLPRDFVVKNKIKSGSHVAVLASNGSITFSTNVPEASKYEMIADNEFTQLVKEVESRYKNALDELAHLP